jgi:tripartite-type tricarboxylate transporter receptor subunit TctC
MKHSTSLRRLSACLLSAVGFFVSSAQVQAQAQTQAEFPTKAVRLVVPFAPGGSTDLLARFLSKTMFPGSGQPIIVDNVPGAGGNIGAAAVARAPADGYTLEIGAMSTHAMNGSLYKKVAFDPMKDFDTVAMLAYVINVIAVSPSLPVKNFPELVAYIRANPGKVNYASGGIGTHNHLTLALLAKTAGLDITHVPYKGGGPAVTALVQGEVHMFAGGASLLLQHAKAGKVRLIAVTEATRSNLLPEIPAVAETIPGFEVTNWYGVFGPRGLDPAVRTRLNREVNRIMTSPELAGRLTEMGMVTAPVSPAELSALLQKDFKTWSNAISSMSITSE